MVRLMDLRERTRRAVQADIAAAAVGLFLEHGFEATTMDQVAAAAGISRRSLFRYFETKEDMVLGNLRETGREIQAQLAARPPDEPPWDALRAALKGMIDAPGYSLARVLKLARMLYETPSLRARHLEKQLEWLDLLAPEIARRLPPAPGPDPRARALVACALTCLDAATEAWVQAGGEGDVEQLYDQAVAAVRS
jgi:AcrR family transcriptional regulator